MNRRYDATSKNRISAKSCEGRIVATVNDILVMEVIESKNSSEILNILNKNSDSIPKPNFSVYMKGEEIARIYDIIGNTSMPYFIAKIIKTDINKEKIKDLINKEISIKLSNKPVANKRKK